ncbi:ABC transporter ATP-binding protein [Paenibacillus cremeus]|uniref:ABC transporter ATP-binding protein n=1 Tax=Paenibacillus cremeus TaxID=2163881 RepID=A0A559JVJ9_9BACL|nr:ABC transporter ATP-binding protein [Paenibacillus cremeus]TVY03924.1 ABC transporter ATP-binding protein [Paenibacillus cremeus]
MLTVRNLTKAIDGKTIIERISFEIHSGTITGLVGRNGVGKSTLLRLLAGILDPDQGEVLLDGVNLTQHPLIKMSMYYVPDSISMFNGYTAKELVKLHRHMYEPFDEQAFYAWLDRFQLPANRSLRSFSKGMKALLSIILALSTRAKLILLDEPTNGLDVIVKKQIMQLLIEEVSERQIALLISSHHLQELEKIADVVLMLKDTTIESVLRIDEVKMTFKKVQVAFADMGAIPLGQLADVEVLSQVGRVTTLLLKRNAAQTLELLQRLEPLLLEELPVTIEDLFISTLGGGDRYVS